MNNENRMRELAGLPKLNMEQLKEARRPFESVPLHETKENIYGENYQKEYQNELKYLKTKARESNMKFEIVESLFEQGGSFEEIEDIIKFSRKTRLTERDATDMLDIMKKYGDSSTSYGMDAEAAYHQLENEFPESE